MRKKVKAIEARKQTNLERKKEEARKLLNVLMRLDDVSLLLVENSINLLASRDAINNQKNVDKYQDSERGEEICSTQRK